MKIYDDTIIYLVAPAYYRSGGPEAMHRLCSALLHLNLNAVMYYLGKDPEKNPVPVGLENYRLPVSNSIDDKPHNIIIFPEAYTHMLPTLHEIQKMIWWVSVDNFFVAWQAILENAINSRSYLQTNAPSFFSLTEIDHIIPSEYARLFLEHNRVPEDKIYFIRDYCAPNFMKNYESIDISKKENIIAYNPKKGIEFTKKLIASAPDLKFVPIQNMTADQVAELLAKSKIYIDFGNHPGRDRIPREAALSHCVVVTGRQGSAANDIDVQIPADCKFDDSIGNVDNIVEPVVTKLRYIIENFQVEHDRQKQMQQESFEDREKFFQEVESVFALHSTQPRKIIPFGTVEEINRIFQKLFDNKKFKIVFVANDELVGQVVKYKGAEILIISEADAILLHDERRIDQLVGVSDKFVELMKKSNVDPSDYFVI